MKKQYIIYGVIIVLALIGYKIADLRDKNHQQSLPPIIPTTSQIPTSPTKIKRHKNPIGPQQQEPSTSEAQATNINRFLPNSSSAMAVTEIILHRKAYDLSYNPANKIPNWVAWTLTAEHTKGSIPRKGAIFHEDEDVPQPRALHSDYTRSGYDRGHMCPAGDNTWDLYAMDESFLMTNICPQTHSLNAGDWNSLEQKCRQWAKTYGSIHIVCGPILLNKTHKTIGRNRVVVPEAFFKVVLCTTGKPRAIGFIYRNNDNQRPWGDYVNTVDEVERITGIDFFSELPDHIEQAVESTANLDLWR